MKIIVSNSIFTVLTAVVCAGLTACNSDAQKAALKGADFAGITNLMSLHSWYHAAMCNDLELKEIWVSPNGEFGKTAIWAQSSGYWSGMKKITEKYGNPSKGMMPEPKGGFIWHTITTPVIEIVEDRKTAKGIFYTPGIVGEYKPAGGSIAAWMWEKYGVDSIMENGKWRVWHMKVYTDFAVSVGEPIDKGAPGPGGTPPPSQKQNTAETIGSELSNQGGGAPNPEWDYVYKKQYVGWNKTSTVEMRPRPPKPYRTFNETWSYTDEGE